jgi:phosphoribosylanthranilate isomerase
MTLVKICGITNLEDALVATEAGADFLGFVFYPKSPRCVSPEQAHRIVDVVRRSSLPVSLVGVFVDEEPDTVCHIASRCGLDYAQLHGAEPPEMVTALMERGLRVVKAFRVRDGASLVEIEHYQATAYLLDAYVPGQPGGTGHTFDWKLAVQAKEYGPIILAGGLTPDNVAEAVRATHPWGVDVSSGVEAEPGRKDSDKLRCFIAAVKTANDRGIQ